MVIWRIHKRNRIAENEASAVFLTSFDSVLSHGKQPYITKELLCGILPTAPHTHTRESGRLCPVFFYGSVAWEDKTQKRLPCPFPPRGS